MPVFLTGDFNSPSHLDWTKPTVGVLQNHRYVVEWPVTKFIQEKGLIDSFRETHPDPEKNPIYTWPAGRPFVENSIDGFNPSEDDLPDRVDFVYKCESTFRFTGLDFRNQTRRLPGDHGFRFRRQAASLVPQRSSTGNQIPGDRQRRVKVETTVDRSRRRSRRVDENGIPRFQLLQRFLMQPTAPTLYYVFDVLWTDRETSRVSRSWSAKLS